MCEPVSTTTMFYTTLAMAAASTAASYVSGMQQANAQADYQKRQAEENQRYMDENAKAATAAYIEEAAQENLRMAQTEEANSVELQEIERERRDAAGTAMATSEGAGLAFDMLMADFNRQEAGYRDNALRQLEFEQQQSKVNMTGFQSKANDRINSVRPNIPEPINTPSLAGAAVQFGSKAFDAYNKAYGEKQPGVKTASPRYPSAYRSHTGQTRYSRPR